MYQNREIRCPIFLIPLSFLLVSSLPDAMRGDQYFVDETHLRLPMDADFSRDVDLIDVDGDGDLDIFFTNSSRYSPYDAQQDRLYINDGAGDFIDETEERLPFEELDTRGSAFADYDGDGDYDVITSACNGDQGQFWLNDGKGYFTDETDGRLPDLTYTCFYLVDKGDVDGDGDFDVMMAGYYEPSRLLINDGLGVFADETTSRLPGVSGDYDETREIMLIDFDTDGDLDLFEASLGANRLMMNNGNGFFDDVSDARLPLNFDNSWGAISGDFDHDNSLDIVVNNTAYALPRIWMNIGLFCFDETGERLPALELSAFDCATADVDNDDWLDLVFANRYASSPLQNVLMVNQGEGYFLDVTDERMPRLEDQSAGIAFGDLDGDHDVEIVTANVEDQNRLYTNIGAPDVHAPRFLKPLHLQAMRRGPGPFDISTQVMDNVSVNTGEIEVSLFYRSGDEGGFVEVPTAWRGGKLYVGEIPEQAEGTRVYYYFQAVDRNENMGRDPAEAPEETYGFSVLNRK